MVTIIIIAILLILLISLMITWACHLTDTRAYCRQYGNSTVKKLNKVFSEYNWKLNNDNEFTCGCTSRVTMTLFKFNYKGMMFYNPVEYYKAVYFYLYQLYKYKKQKKEDKKVIW